MSGTGAAVWAGGEGGHLPDLDLLLDDGRVGAPGGGGSVGVQRPTAPHGVGGGHHAGGLLRRHEGVGEVALTYYL